MATTEIYVGIDPGFTGAIGMIAGDASSIEAVELPVIGSGRKREFDLLELNRIIYKLKNDNYRKRRMYVGLEYPTTRPGEGAEACKKFGLGIGLLEGFLTAHHIKYKRIPPNLWTGRLGVPGKEKDNGKQHNRVGAQLLCGYYPEAEGLVYGPRGGVKDGKLDALLIAHWMRIDEQK